MAISWPNHGVKTTAMYAYRIKWNEINQYLMVYTYCWRRRWPLRSWQNSFLGTFIWTSCPIIRWRLWRWTRPSSNFWWSLEIARKNIVNINHCCIYFNTNKSNSAYGNKRTTANIVCCAFIFWCSSAASLIRWLWWTSAQIILCTFWHWWQWRWFSSSRSTSAAPISI